MSAADVAREAARIIDRHGLAKGGVWDEYGRRCIVAALTGTGAPDDEICGVLARARQRLPMGVVEFADAPDTTAADAVKLLLQVADDLDAS